MKVVLLISERPGRFTVTCPISLDVVLWSPYGVEIELCAAGMVTVWLLQSTCQITVSCDLVCRPQHYNLALYNMNITTSMLDVQAQNQGSHNSLPKQTSIAFSHRTHLGHNTCVHLSCSRHRTHSTEYADWSNCVGWDTGLTSRAFAENKRHQIRLNTSGRCMIPGGMSTGSSSSHEICISNINFRIPEGINQSGIASFAACTAGRSTGRYNRFLNLKTF